VKYCDDHVCVCLYLREDISRTTHVIFTNFCTCCQWPWLGPPPAGKRQFWVFYFLVDSALYTIAFGTQTKTAEPIKMLFGMVSGLGRLNSVLREGDDPRRGRGNSGGKCA